MTKNDGFHAIRAGRHHIDGDIADFGDALEIPARVDRQLIVLCDAHRGLGPTGHFFEHRLRFGRRVRTVGQDVEKLALVAVADTYLDLLNAVQYIKLRDAQTRNTVDHDRPLHGCTVEP